MLIGALFEVFKGNAGALRERVGNLVDGVIGVFVRRARCWHDDGHRVFGLLLGHLDELRVGDGGWHGLVF